MLSRKQYLNKDVMDSHLKIAQQNLPTETSFTLCLPETKHKVQKFLVFFRNRNPVVSPIFQCFHTGRNMHGDAIQVE